MMKFLSVICVLFCMMICCSCERVQRTDVSGGVLSKECIFVPEKIKINQLTEFSKSWKITAYIDVIDQFGSRIKTAGIWKFELYQYQPRTSDSRGSRLFFWPEINLGDAKINSGYWQDFLRCYKFELNLENELPGGATYILDAECLTAEDKRITDSIELKL